MPLIAQTEIDLRLPQRPYVGKKASAGLLECSGGLGTLADLMRTSLSSQPKGGASEHIFICANLGILIRIMAFPS